MSYVRPAWIARAFTAPQSNCSYLMYWHSDMLCAERSNLCQSPAVVSFSGRYPIAYALRAEASLETGSVVYCRNHGRELLKINCLFPSPIATICSAAHPKLQWRCSVTNYSIMAILPLHHCKKSLCIRTYGNSRVRWATVLHGVHCFNARIFVPLIHMYII